MPMKNAIGLLAYSMKKNMFACFIEASTGCFVREDEVVNDDGDPTKVRSKGLWGIPDAFHA